MCSACLRVAVSEGGSCKQRSATRAGASARSVTQATMRALPKVFSVSAAFFAHNQQALLQRKR